MSHSVGDLIKRNVDGLWFEAHVLEVKEETFINNNKIADANRCVRIRNAKRDHIFDEKKEERAEDDFFAQSNYTYKILYVDDNNIEDNVEHSDTQLLVSKHDKSMLNETKINEIIEKVEAQQVAKSPPIFVPLNDLLLSDITAEDDMYRQTPRAVIHNKTGILSEKEILEVAEAQAQYQIVNNQPNEKLAIGGGLRGLRGLQKLRKSNSGGI